ncbi:MAG: S8/S53 family peptidase [Thermoplasmatota archaeon]
MRLVVVFLLLATLGGCLETPPTGSDGTPVDDDAAGAPEIRRALVGVLDTVINPYHEAVARPSWTTHPCHSWPGFDCDMQALDLSLDPALSFEEAVAKDRDVWDAVEPGTWYWIPGTAFVAVMDPTCAQGCFLPYVGPTGAKEEHGAWTTGILGDDSPDAALMFSGISVGPAAFPYDPFAAAPVLPDILSASIGALTGVAPAPVACPNVQLVHTGDHPLVVKAAGNDPGHSILLDCGSGDPRVIAVGGASAPERSQVIRAAKDMDVVSSYCRPIILSEHRTERSDTLTCGTSLAAPTVAAGLAKTLAMAWREGLDPSPAELRDALNRSATYDPSVPYDTPGPASIPLRDEAPWLQWGWGFYSEDDANRTLAVLRGDPVDPRPEEAEAHQERLFMARQTLYGTL